MSNSTWPSEFILLGFYEWPNLHFILFVLLLLVYLLAMTGNLTILVIIFFSSNLHTPMYFFLGNLSFLDITLTSTIIPKLLDMCLTENLSITYLECFIQILFFPICATAEFFLLAVMAYDRYVAICCPLRYAYLMNLKICRQLALMSWGFGVLESAVMTGLLSRCSFTKSNRINHFFCYMDSLLELATSSTHEAHMVSQGSGFICGFTPVALILVSYASVIYNILKIRSSEGKRKAFSTCSSHLTVIILFLGIIFRLYIRPTSVSTIQEDKILSLLYTLCIPTLNPIIYSLRNKDVHGAVKKLKPDLHGSIVVLCKHLKCSRTMISMTVA